MGPIGKSGGAIAGINITPLVDVVLVLLIIFMLVIRGDTVDIPNAIPKKAEAEESTELENEQLVLELLKDGKAMLNREEVSGKDFPAKFGDLMKTRSDKKLFVSADDEVPYGIVVFWMSMARKSGASLVALQITPPEVNTIQ